MVADFTAGLLASIFEANIPLNDSCRIGVVRFSKLRQIFTGQDRVESQEVF
jgi:hypothetical protein